MLHRSANAQNIHDPFHVVCQDVQRHFGTDVLECFHLEVRRPHQDLIVPNGCSTVWRRRRIFAGFRSNSLYSSKDGCHAPSVRSAALFQLCTGPSVRSLGKRWLAPQYLAVLFIGEVID